MSSPQVEITADHWLEGGTCTHGGHKQFFINNFSNNTVWQFSYGGFNGAIHLLMGCGRKGRRGDEVVARGVEGDEDSGGYQG